MSRRRTLTALLPFALLLAGCGGSDGGDDGCGTTADLRPNEAYTGAYDIAFAPTSPNTDAAREFRISVLTDGQISGVARDPNSEETFGGTVTGYALDTSDACDDGKTYVDLNYTLADGRTGTLSVSRDSNDRIVGTYPIRGELNGSLTIQPTIITAQ